MTAADRKQQRRVVLLGAAVVGIALGMTLLIVSLIYTQLTTAVPPTFEYTVSAETIIVCNDEMLLSIPVAGRATGKIGSVTITQDITRKNGVSIMPNQSVFEPIERPNGIEHDPFGFSFIQTIDLSQFDLEDGEYIYHRVSRIHNSISAGYGVPFIVESCNGQ